MMIVLTIKNAPATIHHYLSRWFFEISSGVYVGQVSARIRDKIWDDLCLKLQSSQLTMIYPDRTEQRLAFRVHNCEREVVNFDGLSLIRRPYPNHESISLEISEKSESTFNKVYAKTTNSDKTKSDDTDTDNLPDNYVILDIETTGLDPNKDKIIEVGLLNVESGKVKNSYSSLINLDKSLNSNITALTGISDKDLKTRGKTMVEVLRQVKSFIGDKPIVGHNVSFDLSFLEKEGLNFKNNLIIDTLSLSKKIKKDWPSYKLHDLAEQYRFPRQNSHRALSDGFLTYKLFERLKKEESKIQKT